MTKLRRSAITVIFSASIACMVFAAPKLTDQQIADARERCGNIARNWHTTCMNNIPANTTARGADEAACGKGAGDVYIDCLRAEGVNAPRDPANGLGQVSPPPRSNPTKPRKGPGKVSGLPESHPTPTPKKGPNQTVPPNKSNSSQPNRLNGGTSTPTPTPTATPKRTQKQG